MRQAAETLAAPLPALQAEAEQVANTVAYGVHGRRKVGAGETFWQFRRYQPGDMRSTIDWRKSAKSEHLFIREHEWEAADTVWLWRDGAPSTNYRSTFAPVTKWHRASVITIALASLLVRGGERIAALESTSPPASGRAALREFAHTLSIPDFGQSGFPDVRHLPRHAKVVLVSDFFHPYEEIASLLTKLTSAGITGHLNTPKNNHLTQRGFDMRRFGIRAFPRHIWTFVDQSRCCAWGCAIALESVIWI